MDEVFKAQEGLAEVIGDRLAASQSAGEDDQATVAAEYEDDVPLRGFPGDDMVLRERLADFQLQTYPVDPIAGDGNCFPASIAFSLNVAENKHGANRYTAERVREEICDFLQNSPNTLTDLGNGMTLRKIGPNFEILDNNAWRAWLI
jgi:hypothetical protein